MPSLAPEQYRALEPYISMADRLGHFAAYVASGNPKAIRIAYFGRIGDGSTHLLRNAAVAGVLRRSSPARKPNLVNGMQIAAERGWKVVERHEARSGNTDSILLELETDRGVTAVEGAVLFGRARLVQLDGIRCEAPLYGALLVMMNQDVPGVIGHVEIGRASCRERV